VRSLDRAVARRGAGGRPLPSVFPSFTDRRINFRSSEVSIIAGQPGAVKSALALWHATQWVSRFNLRGIYLSADSSELVQAGRALAMVSPATSTMDAEALLRDRDDAALDRLHRSLEGLMFSFEPDISYESMELEVEAFVELWGTYPDFIVVDNLTDVDGQSDDEWGTLRRVMKGLTGLGRFTGAHVMVLHHTSEDHRDDPCPPRKAIQGKVSQKPSLVLTVGEGDDRRKPVCPVKNRYGAADRHGHDAVWLHRDQQNFHFTGA